ALYRRGRFELYLGLRQALSHAFTLNPSRHYYAFCYGLLAMLSIGLVERYSIERGYWMIVTVVLLMKPDRKESVYRCFQRLIGTVLGSLAGEGALLAVSDPIALLPLISGAAVAVPYAAKKNFWVLSFFASLMVIFLLSLPTLGVLDLHLPFVRLEATFYGCV